MDELSTEDLRAAMDLPEPTAVDHLAAIACTETAARIERRRRAFEEMGRRLVATSNEIFERTIRGQPSEVIMHPEIAKLIDEA